MSGVREGGGEGGPGYPEEVTSGMDAAFANGFYSYLLDASVPTWKMNKNEEWAWGLGWRLHDHLTRSKE